MINEKERAEKLEQLVKERDPAFTLTYEEVWKDNRVRPAYILRSEERNCAPTAYCDEPWYQMSDEAVVDYLFDLCEKHSLQIDVSSMLTPEYVKDHVLPRVIPADDLDALSDAGIVYRTYLNIAVIYYLPVPAFPEEGANVQVTYQLLDKVRLTMDEVDAAAMENMAPEVDFISMDSMLRGMLSKEDADIVPPPEGNVPMWIITSRNKVFGSAALLYGEKLFEALREKFGLRRDGQGRQIAILPSSVHELICVFYERQEQLEDFLNMVKEVNATQVAEEDLLGNCVYYHNGNTVCAFA